MYVTSNLIASGRYDDAKKRCDFLLRDSSSKKNPKYWQLQALRAEAIKLGGLDEQKQF